MMCALFLRTRPPRENSPHRLLFERALDNYQRSLGWALQHKGLVLLTFIAMIGLNAVLFFIVPKGFFPQQDTGRFYVWFLGDQDSSFQAMAAKLRPMMTIVQEDPAVDNVVGFTGANSGFGGSLVTSAMIVSLKPLSQRPPINEIIDRLRPKIDGVAGRRPFLGAIQDINFGNRQSGAQYQYTLQSDSVDDLLTWTPRLLDALQHSSVITELNSDLLQRGLQSDLVIDRDTASRLCITPAQIDNTLYDAFGQRQVSVIYNPKSQYHVIMEIDPRYTQFPDSLRDIYVSAPGIGASGTQTSNTPAGMMSGSNRTCVTATKTGKTKTSASDAIASPEPTGNNNSTRAKSGKNSSTAVSMEVETMVPLAAIVHYNIRSAPLSVKHHGQFVASTLSFNLLPGATLGNAAQEINDAVTRIRMPASIHGSFGGSAREFEQSLASEPLLIGAAIAAVYILLGVLYESYIHPITILSTLPSAGVGALVALMLLHGEFDIAGLIGVILLIGIVKKNAIIMIDFAIEAERSQNLSSYDAICQACLLRFRPIMITTTAAILGAVPLALSFGSGSEMRRPLGISIVGGLIVSQLLTLYTTPVLYLYMNRLGEGCLRMCRRRLPRLFGVPSAN
jgi:multidrug efflux pump